MVSETFWRGENANLRHIPCEDDVSGESCAYTTLIGGKPYEMYFVRLETDCIDALYEQLVDSQDVVSEPLRDDGALGKSFCFNDPQGSKFQVWQAAGTESQPLRADVLPLIRVVALYFPVSDPEATLKWYTEYLGVETNDAGQPVMSSGLEFHFVKSVQPGRTLNITAGSQDRSTTSGEVPSRSIVHVDVQGLDAMHQRMLADGQRVMDHIDDYGGCGRSFDLADPDGNKLAIAEFQTVVVRQQAEGRMAASGEQYRYLDWDMQGDQRRFFDAVLNNREITRKVVQFEKYQQLCEEDPAGLSEQIENIKAFNRAHPEHALTVIRRDGTEYVRIA